MQFRQNVRRYQTELLQARPWFKTRTGRKLNARLLRPDDGPRLVEFFDQLSPETRWRRFHTNVDHVSRELIETRGVEMANVDNKTQNGAVVATFQDQEGEHIVGVVRIARPSAAPDAPEAEVAIVIRDDFQGMGVGSELLRRMVLLAKHMHVKTILAIFLPYNEDAIHLFRALNLPSVVSVNHGTTEMRIQVP